MISALGALSIFPLNTLYLIRFCPLTIVIHLPVLDEASLWIRQSEQIRDDELPSLGLSQGAMMYYIVVH